MRARSALIVGGVVLFLAGGAGSDPLKDRGESRLPDWLTDGLLERDDALRRARLLGLRTVAGRSIADPAGPRRGPSLTEALAPATAADGPRSLSRGGPTRGRRRTHDLLDSVIADVEGLSERRPAVATRIGDPKRVVVAYTASSFADDPTWRCLVKRSYDRGKTWSEPVALGLLNADSICADVVLAWSAGGRYLYAAYRNIDSGLVFLEAPPGVDKFRLDTDVDIVVSRSRDGGRTWQGPFIALDGDPGSVTVTCATPVDCVESDVDPGFSYNWPGLATPATGSKWVYVTGTRFPENNPDLEPSAIAFTRSKRSGQHWSEPTILDVGTLDGPGVTVQGSKPAGGHGGDVLVAWYHSGADGLQTGNFEIRTAYSCDRGRSFKDVVVAAADGEEANFFLGPLNYYKLWWTTMFPDVLLDARGRAHVVYTHDPEPGNATTEEGDIRYVTSAGMPYDTWTSPETVNDDGPGRAQGLASLAAWRLGPWSVVDVVWEDTRLAPEMPVGPEPLSSNLYYDVFHARRCFPRFARRGALAERHGLCQGWSTNTRVSDQPSIQPDLTGGERTGVAPSWTRPYVAWTDRRNIDGVPNRDTDVFGSLVQPAR